MQILTFNQMKAEFLQSCVADDASAEQHRDMSMAFTAGVLSSMANLRALAEGADDVEQGATLMAQFEQQVEAESSSIIDTFERLAEELESQSSGLPPEIEKLVAKISSAIGVEPSGVHVVTSHDELIEKLESLRSEPAASR